MIHIFNCMFTYFYSSTSNVMFIYTQVQFRIKPAGLLNKQVILLSKMN